MALVYLLLARDPSLIVADAISQTIKIPRGAVQELRGSLGRLLSESKSFQEPLDKYNLKIYLYKSRVLLGCVAQPSCSDQKAYNALREAEQALIEQYHGRLEIFFKQSNLEPYALNRFIQDKLKKILDDTVTEINQDFLSQTFAKATIVRDKLIENKQKQQESMESTTKLLQESQEMATLGSHFQKNSSALQKHMKRADFWCFSCKCMIMCAAIIVGLILLYFILSWIFCDSGTLFTGC